MSRTKFIFHKGKRILFIDFSRLSADEAIQHIDEAEAIIARQPKGSILCLMDVTEASYSKAVIKKMKEFTKHNEPYIHTSAAVGVQGLMKFLFDAILSFSGRTNLVLKTDMEDAKDWLVAQPL